MKPLLDPVPPLALPSVEDRFLEGGEESHVPDVVGEAENEAREELEDAGWRVSVRQVDNAADRGTVVGQSPRGSALPGETVELSVSSGEAPPAPDAPGDDDDDDDDGGDGD
jgi:beta-lactam-binding protein with PASTA domain